MQAPQGTVQKLGDFWATAWRLSGGADGAKPIAPLLDRINGISGPRTSRPRSPRAPGRHPGGFNFSPDVDLKARIAIRLFLPGGWACPTRLLHAYRSETQERWAVTAAM